MADPKYRIRLPGGGNAREAVTVSVGTKATVGQYYSDILPAKAFCLTDDVLKVADSASFTVANANGANNGKFIRGRRVEIDASDPDVAGGQWIRVFTGRVTTPVHSSNASGSIIRVDCMDLGWHLTSCCALPLQNTEGVKLNVLCSRLINPTWGMGVVTVGNVLNRSTKQGRLGVQRAQPHNPENVLPPIQVEPGQTPWQILEEYFKREGFLLNVSANGDIIVFQPDYFQPTLYAGLEYHGSDEGTHAKNNVIDPSLSQAIDGIYSESQCWSTVVVPTEAEQAAIAQNPNAQYRHTSYKPSSNPLPFYRLQVVVDGEAINPAMRFNRAVFGYQMGAFQSTIYECSVRGHSSKPSGSNIGTFFASDTMIPVDDTVNGPTTGAWYVQAVQKSITEEHGVRTKLTLRLPLLDPSLQASISGGGGGGARRAAAGATTTSSTVDGQGNVSTVVVPKVVK